jgi:putative hydrolase of the HAD superfamily
MLSLLREKGISLGIITDGLALVQRNKLNALQLDSMVDVIICTDAMGREYWKPSEIPFLAALESLGGVSPRDAVYVADDVKKDFIAPRELGMSSIRIASGGLLGQAKSGAGGIEADIVVDRIEDIIPIVLG